MNVCARAVLSRCRAWTCVSQHLVACVWSWLRREPRFVSFQPILILGGVYALRLSLAEDGGELFVAHSEQVDVYDMGHVGRLLRHWTVAVEYAVNPVDMYVHAKTQRVVVFGQSDVYTYAWDGTLVHQWGEYLRWVLRGYDITCNEIYASANTNVVVGNAQRSAPMRQWGPSQHVTAIRTLGSGLVLAILSRFSTAASQTGVELRRAVDGTVLHKLYQGHTWDAVAHDGVVFVLCCNQIILVRLFDGAPVGQWTSLSHINSITVAQDGRLVASDGGRVYVAVH